jgi:hypothetical protein
LQQLIDIGGHHLLLKKYDGLISYLLSSIYPEYEWLPWKFAVVSPRNYWEDIRNRRKFTDWAAKELNVKKMSDWYKVTTKVKI